MSGWGVAAAVLLASLVPCLVVTMRGDVMQRFVGLQVASGLATLFLVCESLAQGESSFLDLALVTATLSFGGGLVFVRFLERWL